MPRWPCGISWVWLCALLGCTTAVFSAEPTSWLGQAQHCPAVPDQMRPPVRLFTQLQEPPQEAGVFSRPSPSFHPATQSPASFTTAPPAPSISLAPFCPPTVKLMPFVPPCVSTFQIHTHQRRGRSCHHGRAFDCCRYAMLLLITVRRCSGETLHWFTNRSLCRRFTFHNVCPGKAFIEFATDDNTAVAALNQAVT
jgi:hypothetical protein